jgi:hypothetical protein
MMYLIIVGAIYIYNYNNTAHYITNNKKKTLNKN